MWCIAVGALALQILTTHGSMRVVSVVTAIISVGAAVLCGRALYRAALRRERATVADGGPTTGVEKSPRYGIIVASASGAIAGPGIAAAVSPSLYLPVVSSLMLVPVVYIGAAARDPLNPRVR